MHRCPAFLAVLVLLTLTGSATAQDCRILSQHPRGGVQGSPQGDIDLWSLYEYAQIARIAYGEAPRNSCEIADTGERVALAIQDIRVVPLELREYERLDFGTYAGYYYGTDGVLYVTCRRDRVVPQFAITAYRIFRDFSDGEPRLLDVLLSVVLVRERTALVNLPGPREELGLVHLDRYGSNSARSAPETLLAIRGTDPKRIAEIMASAMDLTGGSCVFDVAVRVVDRIENEWGRSFSVVGHSLGGSATQYVARERAHLQSNSQSANVTFSAYSFNGVGLAGTASGASGPRYNRKLWIAA